MKFIRIDTGEYYDKPEFYPFMPEDIFNALEQAELKRTKKDEIITTEVPEDDFNKMLEEFQKSKKQ